MTVELLFFHEPAGRRSDGREQLGLTAQCGSGLLREEPVPSTMGGADKPITTLSIYAGSGYGTV